MIWEALQNSRFESLAFTFLPGISLNSMCSVHRILFTFLIGRALQFDAAKGYLAPDQWLLYTIPLKGYWPLAMHVHRDCSWACLVLFKQWLLRIGVRGLWSVMIVELLMPARSISHFSTTHITANSSNLTACLNSASLIRHVPLSTRPIASVVEGQILSHDSLQLW